MIKIAVIDGQGGGIGRAIVEKIKKDLKGEYSIIVLGTNAVATVAMMKAGAEEGATGENAIIYNCKKVDVIIGATGIIVSNSMLGEFTGKMACAVTESPALKILIPISKCKIEVAGIGNDSLPLLIDKAIKRIGEIVNG